MRLLNISIKIILILISNLNIVYLKPIIGSSIFASITNPVMEPNANHKPQIKGIMRCPGYVHESFSEEKNCMAQLWKLTNNSYNTGYLQNRNGTWKYGDKLFTIPDEGNAS